MIINSRADLDNAPQAERDKFLAYLAGTINKYAWQDGQWLLVTDESAVARLGFTAADFPDAPVPEMPSHNPDAPEPPPATIAFRQAIITALSDGWFSESEGRTWLQRNGVPAIVQAAVDALPAENQFAAEASLYGMTEVVRDDPLTLAMVRAALESAAGGAVSDQEVIDARDDFFRRAAQV
jgi:hypothetical protein